MPKLQLYHGATSVCSQKVRLGLAEIGLDYQSHLIDLQKGEQFAPSYLRLNPDAVVPTLVDDGLTVVESSLILEYLDRRYNGGRLMPDNPAAEVAARRWLLRCLAIHGAINTLTFSTAMRDRILASKSANEIAKDIAKMPDPLARLKRRDLLDNGLASVHVDQALNVLRRTFQEMDAALSSDTWVSGPIFGISDIALAAYVDRIDRLGFSGMWQFWPSVGLWLKTIRARNSYDAAIAAFIPESAAAAKPAGSNGHWQQLRELWEMVISSSAAGRT